MPESDGFGSKVVELRHLVQENRELGRDHVEHIRLVQVEPKRYPVEPPCDPARAGRAGTGPGRRPGTSRTRRHGARAQTWHEPDAQARGPGADLARAGRAGTGAGRTTRVPAA